MKLIEKGFFKRNKKFLLASFILFFVFSFLSAGVSFVLTEGSHNAITNHLVSGDFNHNASAEVSEDIQTVDLFIHNFTVNCMVIVGGLLFSIISVLIFIFNAISIAQPFGYDLIFASSSILPHAIFEYSATCLALAIAFMITKIEIDIIKNRNFTDTIKERKVMLKDMLVIFIVLAIFTLVAAFIESNVTGLVVNSVYGL